MAQDIVSGLFGLSPYQVEQQQRQGINQQAAQFAQMPAVQRGVMGLYQGGAGLANIGAGMMGMVNPEVEQAKMRESAMSGLDISSPEAIMQRAQQIQDPRIKMQLQMLAQQKMAEAQKARLEQLKLQNELNPWAKRDQSKFTPESVAEAMRTGDMSKLVPIEKQMTPSEYAKMLMEGGLDPQSPEFKQKMMAYVEAKRTGTEKGAGTTIKLPPQEGKFEEKLGEKQVDEIFKSKELATTAQMTLTSIEEAKANLRKGIISGTGADARVVIATVMATLGFDTGDALQNTRAYAATTAQMVGQIIKQFGAGTGLSDADREYAKKMAGGDIAVDEKSLSKVLEINEKIARFALKRHNALVKDVKSVTKLSVDEPAPYVPPVNQIPDGVGAPPPGAVRRKGG